MFIVLTPFLMSLVMLLSGCDSGLSDVDKQLAEIEATMAENARMLRQIQCIQAIPPYKYTKAEVLKKIEECESLK